MMRSREDTTEIVRFLLRLETPAQEGRDAVDAPIKWLREMRLTGLRTERIKTTAVTFERHRAGFDVVLVKDGYGTTILGALLRNWDRQTDLRRAVMG